jgi:hypothetical protein
LAVLIHFARGVLRERTSDELYQIQAGELPLVVAAASHGDVSAAERLQDHFLFWAEEPATAQVWMRRAADLGSKASRDLLVDQLARSDREPDRVEAKELAARWRKGQ